MYLQLSDERDPKYPYTFALQGKKSTNAMLHLTNDNVEDQYMLLGIYHSHPMYAKDAISAAHLPDCPPNGTPFKAIHPDPCYRTVKLPFQNITMKACVVHVHEQNFINLEFSMVSTDPKSK